MLIGFIEGTDKPKLALYNDIIFKNDTTLLLDWKNYTKDELLNEIKYCP